VGNTEEEKDECERWAIEQMFKIIYTFKPDIITAHNGENFDWNMIIDACSRLGMPIAESSAPYFNGDFIRKSDKVSSLKLGGEREDYYETIVPGVIVTDSLHAVRRAQALDSNMLRADLKYVTEYSKMKKPNRVYVPGEKISETWNDKNYAYAFCEENGDWYKYDPSMEDTDNGEVYDGKKSFIPVHGFIRDGYELRSGRYVVERYLLDDLWECEKVEYRYNTPNFLICKMLPVPYKKCTTMGTAGQWKALMLAWSYEQGIAVPMFRDKYRFTGGLSRLLRTGFVKKVIKLDYNSLYPSIILTWGISDPTDLMCAMLDFLNHVLTQREKYKNLKKVAGKKKGAAKTDEERRKYAEEESFNDKKQLPLKILGNSFFGSYGAPDVFPWGSIKCAEQITCIGRMSLRLMISHFKKIGYEPIVGDTDGFNFALPDDSTYRYTEENPYVSTGLSRETEKGKAYTGFKADVAEFNDIYMCDKHYAPNAVNKMGLGIDEVVESTINFSRKNYADYFPDNPYPEDVKLVGNTIKSKKMPEYIAKFLAVGIRLLLQGKGQEFLEEYYKYVDKIYNYRIPLRDIATKGKINPLIGSAGVSAVPMAARVSQKVGAEADPTNFLLMHAMGPNVAGVIGTAVVAGTFMAVFGIV
jgi:DNA polymerase elongation subunit (family B)